MSNSVKKISSSEFFYRQKTMTGFSNPRNGAFQTIREIVENCLDSAERILVLPEIKIDIKKQSTDFMVQVIDNGAGVSAEEIPIAFASMLSSSKYRNRQDRGLFGIGIKNVLLQAQITTNKPYIVASATPYSKKINVFELMIDIETNQPIIVKQYDKPNTRKWRGLILRFFIANVDFEGALQNILIYLSQTSISTPQAKITFILDKKPYVFERKVTSKPSPSIEIDPHPYDIDPLDFKNLIESTKTKDMFHFLTNHFQRVGGSTANKFLTFAGINKALSPKSLSPQNQIAVIKKMSEFDKWLPPSTNCLSLIGKEGLIAGVKSTYSPDFTVYSARTGVFGGTSFAVEVCIAIGGEIKPRRFKDSRSKEEHIIIQRFINKIPVIRDYSSCLTWKVVKKINWNNYKFDPSTTPTMIFMHICSTSKRSLFKDLTKGIIANIDEVRRSLDLTLKDCLRKTSHFASHKHKLTEHKRRVGIYALYSSVISDNISTLTGEDRNNVQDMIFKVLDIENSEKS